MYPLIFNRHIKVSIDLDLENTTFWSKSWRQKLSAKQSSWHSSILTKISGKQYDLKLHGILKFWIQFSINQYMVYATDAYIYLLELKAEVGNPWMQESLNRSGTEQSTYQTTDGGHQNRKSIGHPQHHCHPILLLLQDTEHNLK